MVRHAILTRIIGVYLINALLIMQPGALRAGDAEQSQSRRALHQPKDWSAYQECQKHLPPLKEVRDYSAYKQCQDPYQSPTIFHPLHSSTHNGDQQSLKKLAPAQVQALQALVTRQAHKNRKKPRKKTQSPLVADRIMRQATGEENPTEEQKTCKVVLVTQAQLLAQMNSYCPAVHCYLLTTQCKNPSHKRDS